MENKKDYPLHRWYLLLDNHTKETFEISLYGKTYMFIVNKQYFLNQKKDFFSLGEKLYILNLPYDVIWCPITFPQVFYKVIFHNIISPFNLKLNIIKGRVIPYISKGGF